MWKLIIGLTFLVTFCHSAEYNFTISTTWDNQTIEEGAQIHISLSINTDAGSGTRGFFILVDAPFHNDPAAPNASIEEPFEALVDYEVVQFFFLGNRDEYLVIQLAPSGHYNVQYFQDQNELDRYMPLHGFSSEIQDTPTGQRWIGEVTIPIEYFPQIPRYFNVYSSHLSGEERSHNALFPVEEGSLPSRPDFHNISVFQPIGLFAEEKFPEFQYKIDKSWDNQGTDDDAQIFLNTVVINATLDGSWGLAMQITIDAPFYNDPLAPDAPTDEPLMGLWDYEVVEAFFLGDGDEYIEMEFAPSGHYVTLYLNGYRNDTGRYMPLKGILTNVYNDTTSIPMKERWTGQALIPASYFPCNVTKFNAYAIHKSEDERRYMSLFPVTDGAIQAPDFHYLEAFGNIHLEEQLNTQCNKDDRSGASALYITNVHVTILFALVAILFSKF